MRVLIFVAAMFAAGGAYAEPVRYVLDPAHTQVAFTIDRLGFTHILGGFEAVEGELILDEENPAASSVRATIQVASLDAGNDTRDEHVRSDRWLNAAQFPTMEFRSTGVRLVSETRAEVTGDLTLMGQTHPVTLDVTLNKIDDGANGRRAAGFSATGSLTRSQWGLSRGVPNIGDEVSIRIETLAQVPATE
jgi:polyisoprenoid-binding protein YceI